MDDWPQDDQPADGADLGDLGSADTADLGPYGEPWLAADLDSGLADDGLDDDGLGDELGTDGLDTADTHPVDDSGISSGVDAHVDEPLHPPTDPLADEPELELPADEPPAEPLFGADPDPLAGGTEWAEPQFPPVLALGDLPEPVDGPPWTDADLLGAEQFADTLTAALVGGAGPEIADLLGYAGLELPAGGDPWAALAGAEDPATSALARWWAPR